MKESKFRIDIRDNSSGELDKLNSLKKDLWYETIQRLINGRKKVEITAVVK